MNNLQHPCRSHTQTTMRGPRPYVRPSVVRTGTSSKPSVQMSPSPMINISLPNLMGDEKKHYPSNVPNLTMTGGAASLLTQVASYTLFGWGNQKESV